MEGRKGGSEGVYYKGREEWVEGGREGGRVFQREGGSGEGERDSEGVITKGGGRREGGREVWEGREGRGREREGGYYKGR